YLVEDGETPGIVLGILEADGSTRVVSYGSGGPGTRPLGPKSEFEIGSINKTFTAAVLAGMVARGEVSLSDPISKYLPDSVRVPSRNGRQITVLDLATHFSALPRIGTHVPANRADPYADYTVEKMYSFLATHELRRDPGAEGEYSNLGMGLLGHALGRTSGTNIQELIRRQITEPLGMRATTYARPGETREWMTRGHNNAGEVVPYWGLTDAMAGAGGLRSNAEDMLVYLRANVGPPTTDVHRAIRSAHEIRREVKPGQSIGLAWNVVESGGRKLWMHGGGTAGYITMIAFDPERRVGFVQLSNSGGFDDDIGRDFLRRGPPLNFPVVAVPDATLRSYVGEYELQPGRRLVVRREDDGSMTLRAPDNVRFRMYAKSPTEFYLKRTPWQMTFTRDGAGVVTGMTLDMEGTPRTARKISSNAPTPAEERRAILDLPLTAEVMAAYSGQYAFPLGARTMEVRVFVEDGKLMAQPAGQSASRLRSQGGHAFVAVLDDDVRFVFTVENGRATGATFIQGGRSTPGRRAP
ncbi:MAG TPA: serine hydrolase, partial [Longimicrobium sp.]